MTEAREYITREIPYWLYKTGYSEFQATEYNPGTKTIKVTLPKTKPIRWPKEWKQAGNSYRTPKGTKVYYWNTGLARNYDVRRVIGPYYSVSRTIGPGIDSFSRVLNTVEEFEAI